MVFLKEMNTHNVYRCTFCNRNEMIDIFSYGSTIRPPACCTMAFEFNKDLMADLLTMIQNQFQIIDHGFLQILV